MKPVKKRDLVLDGKHFVKRPTWLKCPRCGCRYNGGSHREIKMRDTTVESEAAKLQAAYQSVMGFDRVKFHKHAPQWMKDLLKMSSNGK